VATCWLAFCCFALVTVIFGCSRAENFDSQPEQQTEKIGVQKDKTADVDNDESGQKISFSWEDEIGGKIKPLSKVDILITNISMTDISLDLQLECDGMVNKTATMDIGSLDLNAGESETLSFKAKEMPIQSEQTIGALRVRARISIPGQMDDESLVTSQTLYYRHEDDYNKVIVFSERDLVDQFDGILVDKEKLDKNNKDLKIGRIRKQDKIDEFDDVFADDSSYDIIGENGQYLGRIVGQSFEEDVEEVETEDEDTPEDEGDGEEHLEEENN